MAKPRVSPGVRLARNLKALIKVQGISAPKIADMAKVDRKTVNNMLNGRYDPRLSIVEKVANVFGFTTWQMLAHDMEIAPPDSRQVVRLLEHYSNAPDDARLTIMRVAEMSAHEKPAPPPASAPGPKVRS